MRIHSIRLVAYLVPLFVASTGASLASSAPVGVVAGHATSIAFCPADASVVGQRATTSPRTRLALKCRCCGRDENGHCNHQCCTD